MSFVLFFILNQVNITIPDTTVEKGKNVIIPINASDLTGLEVYSSDITVKYRSEVLIADSVSKTGTLSQDWMMDYNTDTLGEVKIAMAAVDPAVGSGALIKIAFHVPGSAMAGDTGTIYFTRMMLNEGDPACNATAGLFTVDTAPAIEEENSFFVEYNPKLEASPNPFSGTTVIKLQDCNIIKLKNKIQICDISGKVVKSFLITESANNIFWDGKDESGKSLAGGIYFCKAEGTDSVLPIKLVLLR